MGLPNLFDRDSAVVINHRYVADDGSGEHLILTAYLQGDDGKWYTFNFDVRLSEVRPAY